MKFSVFTEMTIFVQVEVEAEDHIDAAQKVALAAVSDGFLTQHSEYLIDGIGLEIVTAAEVRAAENDETDLAEFNAKVVTFTPETISGWLMELAEPPAAKA